MKTVDSQQVELFGRSFLLNELVTAGYEVALPLRDRGVDLMVYQEHVKSTAAFIARPIQMKSASTARFDVSEKYGSLHSLIIAFVWHLADSSKTCTYAMTYAESIAIAEKKGWTKSDNWANKGAYNTTNPDKVLIELLQPYKMDALKWHELINNRF
jgi:hypothetical protein